MIVKSQRWKKTAMAAAAAAVFGIWGSNAAALSLGRITVQSALGEALRAEIEVPDINAEEANSLKTVAASPEAFRAAGLEYNPAMAGLRTSLQRRADGRSYIRLSSDRVINDPFVDMIFEASWSSGRVVRDYTMLFDPPSLRQAAPVAPTPAQIPAQSTPSRAASFGLTPTPAMRPVEPRKSTPKTPVRPAVFKTPSATGEQVMVKSGDTAGKIAATTKPANISLDQMLVALLRANPTAFIGDNVNRVKAGSVINIPTEEQAKATSTGEATQIIVAQSKDFNDFRRKLASNAPSAQVAAADRKANGSVQAKVEDKKPVTAAPDKLTLSKGALQGPVAEDQLAKERSAKEAATRAAEITKNISDLSKLGAASNAAVPGSAASAAAQAAVVAAVTAPGQAASAPAAASSTPSQAASAASAAAKGAVTLPVPAAEPSLVDGLIENPLVPAGAVGLIALLVGFGLYRVRQSKKAALVDSNFLESHLQPDSFFGASGGQSVDTSNSAATGSSMLYSPSQLDAVDDVDPVAEADVYLAYGRDLQAEEILKDALRTNPERIAIQQKLLEILAKRLDTKGFEEVAKQAFHTTNGGGSDWERICELGLTVDPGNALYQPGGQPLNPDGTLSIPAPLEYSPTLVNIEEPLAPEPNALSTSGSTDLDLDLDLDFSLDEEPTSAISETTASDSESEPTVIDLDFGLATKAMTSFEKPSPAATTDTIGFSLPDLDIADDELTLPSTRNEDFKLQAATSFGTTSPAPLINVKPDEPADPDLGMLEFDLGSLSLDLGDTPEAAATTETVVHEDPLATKLALADEFRAIGDDDGARALIEEVISEASGDMKVKAQLALSHL